MSANQNFLPTQLYVSLDAPNQEMFRKVNRSVYKDGWDRLNRSLEIIGKLNVRRVIRVTVIKGINDSEELLDSWAAIIKKANPEFLEIKSYMHIGMSQKRLSRENMMIHTEVQEYANKMAQATGYVVKDESIGARIVLLVRPDIKDKSTKLVFEGS